MKFTRHGSVQLMAGLIVGVGAIVVACGGDEESTGNTPAPDGGSTSSGGSSSGATSSSGGSSGAASSSGSTTTDGGGNDAASEGGTGTKNNGDDCGADNECKSGQCWQQDYCTIACTMKEQTDPVCTALGGDFTGKCNKQGFCQKK